MLIAPPGASTHPPPGEDARRRWRIAIRAVVASLRFGAAPGPRDWRSFVRSTGFSAAAHGVVLAYSTERKRSKETKSKFGLISLRRRTAGVVLFNGTWQRQRSSSALRYVVLEFAHEVDTGPNERVARTTADAGLDILLFVMVLETVLRAASGQRGPATRFDAFLVGAAASARLVLGPFLSLFLSGNPWHVASRALKRLAGVAVAARLLALSKPARDVLSGVQRLWKEVALFACVFASVVYVGPRGGNQSRVAARLRGTIAAPAAAASCYEGPSRRRRGRELERDHRGDAAAASWRVRGTIAAVATRAGGSEGPSRLWPHELESPRDHRGDAAELESPRDHRRAESPNPGLRGVWRRVVRRRAARKRALGLRERRRRVPRRRH